MAGFLKSVFKNEPQMTPGEYFEKGAQHYNAKEYEKAFRCYSVAAEQGHIRAQFRLGRMYQLGEGVTQSYEQSFIWTKKAAEQGYMNAQYNLSLWYRKGQGVERDVEQSFIWMEKAAEQGDAEAQFNLAIKYGKGEGVTENPELSFRWMKKAAQQGYMNAQYNLGVKYYNGRGVEKDLSQALLWHEKALAQGYEDSRKQIDKIRKEMVDTIFEYGVRFYKQEEYIKAAECFQVIAHEGDVDGQYNLAIVYHNGYGVDKDQKQALYWAEKAADQGSEKANALIRRINLTQRKEAEESFNQGLKYNEVGRYEQAAACFRNAADGGFIKAQINLAVYYATGKGVERNFEEAEYWAKKAVAQGNRKAEQLLGMIQHNMRIQAEENQADSNG